MPDFCFATSFPLNDAQPPQASQASQLAGIKTHLDLADGPGEAGGEGAWVDWIILHAHSLAILLKTHRVQGEQLHVSYMPAGAGGALPAGGWLACAARQSAA